MIVQIIGPPGTGKTTTIADVVNQIPDPSDVVALAFTRAAKWALHGKAPALNPDWNILTLHSRIWKFLDLKKENILRPWHIRRFFESWGIKYNVKQDESALDVAGAKGNVLEALFGKMIHVAPVYGGDYRKTLRGIYTPGGDQGFYTADFLYKIFKSWEAFQLKEGLISYDFMLSLGEKLEVGGSHFILDEAQDLTPLMIKICRRNFKNFNYTYVIGDDDQSIFQFSGADPTFMVDMIPDKRIVLDHSWRLAPSVWKLSQEYIRRNKNRTDKAFTPSDHPRR